MINKKKIDVSTTTLLKSHSFLPPRNLRTTLEHWEKLLSNTNNTIPFSCIGDHWTDLKHIQITRTAHSVRTSWRNHACSAWTRRLRGPSSSPSILGSRLLGRWSQSLYWGAQQHKMGKRWVNSDRCGSE